MAYALIWLAEILIAAGLRVAEQPGWRARGRGDVAAIRGVMCHHTAARRKDANAPSLGLVTHGRPAGGGCAALPGPLSQLLLGRDGTFYVVAAGRANHAGPGIWNGVRTGNASFVGIEAENSGLADDSPWPAAQMDAYAHGAAAILKHVGADASWCCGHKEYRLPPGCKIDPSFDMGPFRARVAAILAGTAAPPAPIPARDDWDRATLRRGMARRGDVATLQQKLGLAADGLFGPGTEAMVRALQRAHALVPDGIVGPRTWASIMAD